MNAETLKMQTQSDENKEDEEDENLDAATTIQVRCVDCMRKFQGVFYGLFSALLMGLSSVFIKRVIIFTGSDITLIRYTLQIVSMYLIIKWKHLNMFGPKEMRFSLLMRGSIGVVGLMSMHFAVKFIDPSDSQAIFNTSLLLTAINARIFLGEKLNLGHIVSLILTCVGVVFISQPKFLFGSAISINSTMTTINATANNSSISNDDGSAINRVTGIGLAMAGAAAAAIVPIIIKHLANHKVHFSVMIIYASYFGIPASVFISFLYAVVLNKPFSERLKLIDNRTDLILWDVFYSIMSAITGLAQQIFWNLTIKYEDASRSAVLRSLNIVFVFFLQYIFLNIKSNLFSIIGAILILFGTIFIITFKILDSKYSIKKEQKQPNTTAECEKNYDDDEEKSGLLMRKLIFYKI